MDISFVLVKYQLPWEKNKTKQQQQKRVQIYSLDLLEEKCFGEKKMPLFPIIWLYGEGGEVT